MRKVDYPPVTDTGATGVRIVSIAVFIHREPWMSDALCREHPELSWVPRRGETTSRQRAVCARCAVCAECRQHGIATRAEGIWGGLTSSGRKVLITAANKAAA